MKQSTNFEIKKKIVLAGNSKIFNNWKEHSSITVENFIDALEWLCEDQFDEYGRTTREIGLEPNRVVRLCAIYDKLTGCAGYVDIEELKNSGLHKWWEGALFDDGFRHKIMLSAKENV